MHIKFFKSFRSNKNGKLKELLIKKSIITNGKEFNWKNHSGIVAIHFSQYLDITKFNWNRHSWVIAQYHPDKINPNKYNWKEDSWAIAKYCPKNINPNKYNWKESSSDIIKYCPAKMDTTKACLKEIIKAYPQYKNMYLKEIKTNAILNKV